MQKQFLLFLSLSIILLSGCSSGGGGKPHVDAGDLNLHAFSKWSETPSDGVVVINGTAQNGTYTGAAVTDEGIHDAQVTVVYEKDAIVKIILKTHDTNATWDTRNGDTIDASGAVINIHDATKNNVALLANAKDPDHAWEYQTFGAWMTGRTANQGTFGSNSVGAETAGSAIPRLGTATFNGSAGGIYIDPAGTNYTASSDVTVVADFANRNLDLSTSGTTITNIGTGAAAAAANLDMTGTLSYDLGKNKFTGNVAATGLNGTSTGHFYGPTAEELGGVFNLAGAGVEAYSGGYGAKK